MSEKQSTGQSNGTKKNSTAFSPTGMKFLAVLFLILIGIFLWDQFFDDSKPLSTQRVDAKVESSDEDGDAEAENFAEIDSGLPNKDERPTGVGKSPDSNDIVLEGDLTFVRLPSGFHVALQPVNNELYEKAKGGGCQNNCSEAKRGIPWDRLDTEVYEKIDRHAKKKLGSTHKIDFISYDEMGELLSNHSQSSSRSQFTPPKREFVWDTKGFCKDESDSKNWLVVTANDGASLTSECVSSDLEGVAFRIKIKKK